MFFLSLLGAALLWAVALACYANLASRTRKAVGFGAIAAVSVFFCAGVLMNGLFAIQGLVLAVVGWTSAAFAARTSRYAIASLVGSISVFGGFGALLIPTLLERAALRREYPFESLTERLAYEQRDAGPIRSSEKQETSDSTGDRPKKRSQQDVVSRMEEWLDENNAMETWQGRSEALRIIHTSYVEQFVDSPGFGVGRMLRMREPEQYARIDEPRSISLPRGECVDLEGSPPGGPESRSAAAARDLPTSMPQRAQLATMHELSMIDFLNRKGWGYIRDRDQVAGFQPHQFRQTPGLPTTEWSGSSTFEDAHQGEFRSRPFGDWIKHDESWTVRRLDLVSLLRHDEPCVYISDELPSMDRLIDVPVRPLEAFEQASLRSLEQGEDVVSDSTNANRIRMLGAIRAAKQCLKCHEVERGNLLGAFSYVLEPVRPIRPKREPAEPVF